MHRKTFGIVSVATAVASFLLGFNFAVGASGQIKQVSLAPVDGGVRLVIIGDGDLPFHVKFNKTTKDVTVFVKATKKPEMASVSYSDQYVESVTMAAGKEPGEEAVLVTFRQPDISFYHPEGEEPGKLVFEFRPKKSSLKIAGISSAQLVAQAKESERKVEEARVKAEAEQAAAGAEKARLAQQAKEAETAKLEAAPASPEAAAEQAVAEAPAEKPAQIQVTPEIANKLFIGIDDTYDKLEQQAGRRLYQQIMDSMRKREYEEMLDSAKTFIAEYPKSVYLEKVYFAKGDALYMISRKDKTRVQEALDAYKDALGHFPKSDQVQRAMMRRSGLYEDLEFNIEAVVELNMAQKVDPKSKYAVIAMINKAKLFAREKKFKRSQAELQKILALYPSRREARDVKYLIAEAYYDQGNYKEANNIFEESSKTWPTYPKAHPSTFMKMADTYYKLGMKDEAMEALISIANLFPGSNTGRKALLKIGDLYLDDKLKKDAVKIYESVAARFPDSDESALARLKMAMLGAEDPELLKHSDIFDYTAFENPLKTFDEIREKYPDTLGEQALRLKAKALASQKRYVASINAYKELLKSYPAVRMSDEVFSLVRDNFLKLIDVYHSNDGFLMVLATYYNNFDPFLKTIKEPDVLIKIADSFGAMTLYGRAADYYRLASENDRTGEYTPTAKFRFAKAKLYNNENIEAEELLRKYMEEYPKNPNSLSARHFLGMALYAQGKKAEAATEWRLALEKDTKHFMVANTAYRLGLMYKEDGRYSLSADAFNLASSAWKPEYKAQPEPDYIVDSRYQLAEAYYRDENYASAINQANRFKSTYPEDKRSLWMDYIISMSLDKVDKDEAAVAKLKELSDKDKESPIGRVAAARLKNAEWKKKNPGLFPD